MIFSQTSSRTFLMLRAIGHDIITDVHRAPCKVAVFLSDSNESLIFSTDFRKILKHQISWKYVERNPSCCIGNDRQTCGQTDRAKSTVALRNLANAPRNINTFQKNKEYFNPLKTKRRMLYLKTQFVPRSKHFSSLL